MTTISSAGIGSGLDVESIVTQLMTIEKQPLTQMKTEASKIDTKISAYGKIQSYVSALRDAAANLTKPATWGDSTATSADTSAVTATGGTTATAGVYSVAVQQLAAGQSLASGAVSASTSTLGSGSLTIELGTWGSGQSSFTAKSGATAIDVAIDADDSLADIRDKINNASAGVKASIVTDNSGARLVLRSEATGEENGFRITATDDDGDSSDAAGLSALAYDPSAGIASMSRTQTAANAKATIDGLSVTSSSNTLTDVVQGVTLKLGKVTSSAVEVNVTSNTENIQKAVTDFATAYNDLAKYLATQTKYDASTKTAGTLQGDASVNSLRGALRSLGGGTSSASSVLQRLSDIGLDPQSDGTLKVDTTKLGEALEGKLGEVRKLFATSTGATDAANGLGYRIRRWSDDLLGVDGRITSRTDSLRRQKDANGDRQDAFQTRLDQVEKRLRAQYTALDTQMSKMNALQSYVTQQIAAMTSSTSS